MKLTVAVVVVGAIVTIASAWMPVLEQWAPLFALWTGGGAHVALIVAREPKNASALKTDKNGLAPAA